MKEILAGDLDIALDVFGINATKTYQDRNEEHDAFHNGYQVWELEDSEFERLCNIKDDQWEDDWGWWRSAEGSNMDTPLKRYNINHHYIMAWDGAQREDWDEENKTLLVDDRWFSERKYRSLLEYFCDEVGASTEKNVCALATHLAQLNGIKMSELFKKYHG